MTTKEDSFLSSFKGTMGIVFAIGFCIMAFAGVSCAGCMGLAAIGAASQTPEERAEQEKAARELQEATQNLQKELDKL